MIVNLKGIFSPQQVAESLNALPDLETTVMDTAFPDRPTHPFAGVGLAELVAVTGTLPVVARGGTPINTGSDQLDTMTIMPQPIKPSVDVMAHELNDLKMLLNNTLSLQSWRNAKVDRLRRLVRETTEAMSSVVLYSGKVDWPYRLEGGGHANYLIDYGAPLIYTLAAKLTKSSTVDEVYALLLAMRTEIRNAGIGGKVAFHAGRDAFSMLLKICQGYTSTVKNNSYSVDLSEDQGVINIAGFKILLMDETYKHPVSGALTPKINPKMLAAFTTDVKGKVWYCALDSISASNAALPFHVVVETIPGNQDSGIRLVAQSKPLPARNPKTVCLAIVVD